MLFANIFTDDQVALIGCFAALAVCGLVAMLSFRFGPAGQSKNSVPSIRLNATRPQITVEEAQERRAA